MSDSGKFKWGEKNDDFLSLEDDDILDGMRLFPDFLPGSTASATECTGLIQAVPATDEVQKIYDNVYSYRQKKPIKR